MYIILINSSKKTIKPNNTQWLVVTTNSMHSQDLIQQKCKNASTSPFVSILLKTKNQISKMQD